MFHSKAQQRLIPLLAVTASLTLPRPVDSQSPQDTTLNTHSVLNDFSQLDIKSINGRRLLFDANSFMIHPNNKYHFHNIDKLDFKFDRVAHGNNIFQLKESLRELNIEYSFQGQEYSIDEYFKRSNVSGFLVLHDDCIITEKYFNGATPDSYFLSNSVAKSFLSIMIGIAINEGSIRSIDDTVEMYLPELKESGFNGITIGQLLQMTSNVSWNEDYTDPNADINNYFSGLVNGEPSFKSLVQNVKKGSLPGSGFSYQSINSQVLAMILEKASGKTLNIYMSDKLWKPIGANDDAFFFRANSQPEISAAGGLNITLRDYSRFGFMVMNRGKIGDVQVVSESWIQQISSPRQEFLKPKAPDINDQAIKNVGYNNHWWLLHEDGAFAALGIYGQAIYINPQRRTVIVQFSAWNEPDPYHGWDEMIKVMETVSKNL